MDTEPLLPAYRQRSWGLTSRNAPLLAPLGLATVWLASDAWHGELSIWSLVGSGLMSVVGLFGLIFILMPVELIADCEGVRWRQFGYRRTIPWSEIEDIGIGVSKAFDGYDRPSVRFLTGGTPSSRSVPTIGINLKLAGRNSATASYRRGSTGFELNLSNLFRVGTGEIVAELQARLQRSRRP